MSTASAGTTVRVAAGPGSDASTSPHCWSSSRPCPACRDTRATSSSRSTRAACCSRCAASRPTSRRARSGCSSSARRRTSRTTRRRSTPAPSRGTPSPSAPSCSSWSTPAAATGRPDGQPARPDRRRHPDRRRRPGRARRRLARARTRRLRPALVLAAPLTFRSARPMERVRRDGHGERQSVLGTSPRPTARAARDPAPAADRPPRPVRLRLRRARRGARRRGRRPSPTTCVEDAPRRRRTPTLDPTTIAGDRPLMIRATSGLLLGARARARRPGGRRPRAARCGSRPTGDIAARLVALRARGVGAGPRRLQRRPPRRTPCSPWSTSSRSTWRAARDRLTDLVAPRARRRRPRHRRARRHHRDRSPAPSRLGVDLLQGPMFERRPSRHRPRLHRRRDPVPEPRAASCPRSSPTPRPSSAPSRPTPSSPCASCTW